MGAVQKLATIVIVGLVALATVLVLYLADEGNRIDAEERSQEEDAIERAMADYNANCLRCHGPAGEGYEAPGERGTGRIGMPIGGNTQQRLINQEGVYANGTPYPGGLNARATEISTVLHEGRGLMPAWGEAYGGPLNDAQIEEFVLMIQHVDWNEVYNAAVEEAGGYPTAPPAATTPASGGEAPATPAGGSAGGDGASVAMIDINFDPKEITIPANTDVTVALVNNGAASHNFTIDALGVASGDYGSGQSGSVTINAAAGEYEYVCTIPGHKEAGMVGTLIVQ